MLFQGREQWVPTWGAIKLRKTCTSLLLPFSSVRPPKCMDANSLVSLRDAQYGCLFVTDERISCDLDQAMKMWLLQLYRLQQGPYEIEINIDFDSWWLIEFNSIYQILSAASWPPEFTQPLTEIITRRYFGRCLCGVKRGGRLKLTI
jgi:hypothetical protein